MADFLLRLVIVAAVLGLAVLAARLWPRWMARRQAARPVAVDGLGPWPAVVVFTSPGCSSCPPALEAVRAEAGDWPVREVSFAREPERFPEAGVEAVPVVVVVDAGGKVRGQFAGVPDRRRLGEVLRAARG